MSVPAPFLFRQPVTSMSSGGTFDTVEIDTRVELLNTAFFFADPTQTAVAVPFLPAGPVQVSPAQRRNSIALVSPSDGQLIYLGIDNTLTPASGHALFPGCRLAILCYTGAIWALAQNGPATLFIKAS
jgi:hypothetical protein